MPLISQSVTEETPTDLLSKASLHGNLKEINVTALSTNVNVKNANGSTPLSRMAKLGYNFLAKYLKRRKVIIY